MNVGSTKEQETGQKKKGRGTSCTKQKETATIYSTQGENRVFVMYYKGKGTSPLNKRQLGYLK